jgi:DNA repair exonuclease SbcCD nuclease subunit
MVSFLHAADLHLGMRTTRFDPTTAQKVREARFAALDNILKRARELKVDFLLIAGDLFDDSAVDTRTAQRAFNMLEAQSESMPVFVLPGNHDPLLAGGVWDRPPWNQLPSKQLSLLDQAAPVDFGGSKLYPCPVLRKTSMDDPTNWIAGQPGTAGRVRIGVAHGSLKIRDDLPPDDHLISRHAASELQLDYLALGHWHSRRLYADPSGVERTAYPGVHEPMRFQGSSDSHTGWIPYGGAGREEFLDSGKGEVLHVRIRAAGEPPAIQPIDVGHYHWHEEKRELTSKEDLERLIQDVATREACDRCLLRLRVSGLLNAENMLRLAELREILAGRYLLGEMDETSLHIQPTQDEIHAAAGQGVLRRVLEKLQAETQSADAATQQVAERAVLLLYQLAGEVRS